MKLLKCIGAILYSVIAGYLLWLLFFWLVPIIMNVGWLLFILYVVFAGGFLTMLIASLTTLLAVPLGFLVRQNMAAKILSVPAFAFFFYSSVKMPFELGMSFGLLQWIIAISLCITIAITFISIATMPFRIDKEDSI